MHDACCPHPVPSARPPNTIPVDLPAKTQARPSPSDTVPRRSTAPAQPPAARSLVRLYLAFTPEAPAPRGPQVVQKERGDDQPHALEEADRWNAA
eukprot:scaffold5781_cov124-Isochrysis_galbana.AAC.20